MPWFSFVLRSGLLLISGTVTMLTPFFLFLTIINNASDALHVRIAVSLIHAIWWGLLLCFVGSFVLLVFGGIPALLVDLYQAYGLLYLICILTLMLILLLVVNIKKKKRKQKRK